MNLYPLKSNSLQLNIKFELNYYSKLLVNKIGTYMGQTTLMYYSLYCTSTGTNNAASLLSPPTLFKHKSHNYVSNYQC